MICTTALPQRVVSQDTLASVGGRACGTRCLRLSSFARDEHSSDTSAIARSRTGSSAWSLAQPTCTAARRPARSVRAAWRGALDAPV